MTHRDRDDFDTQRGVAFLMATGENYRCRCDFPGEGCRRFADREDLLCEWCREHKGKEAHAKACYEMQEAYSDARANRSAEIAQWALSRYGRSEIMQYNVKPPMLTDEFRIEWNNPL